MLVSPFKIKCEKVGGKEELMLLKKLGFTITFQPMPDIAWFMVHAGKRVTHGYLHCAFETTRHEEITLQDLHQACHEKFDSTRLHIELGKDEVACLSMSSKLYGFPCAKCIFNRTAGEGCANDSVLCEIDDTAYCFELGKIKKTKRGKAIAKKEIAGVDFVYVLNVTQSKTECDGCPMMNPHGICDLAIFGSEIVCRRDEPLIVERIQRKQPVKQPHVVGLAKIGAWLEKNGYTYNYSAENFYSETGLLAGGTVKQLLERAGQPIDEGNELPKELVEYK